MKFDVATSFPQKIDRLGIHQNIAARSFTIFPIIIKQAPIALIYIDSASAATINISDNQLSLLKIWRIPAILAIKTLG